MCIRGNGPRGNVIRGNGPRGSIHVEMVLRRNVPNPSFKQKTPKNIEENT
jgi:hypothetical protein